MLLENKDGTAPDDTLPSPEQQPLSAGDCDISSSSQPASPAGSDVPTAGQLAGRLSDVWDTALREVRAAEPAVDDPLHRGMLVFWVDTQEIRPSELPPAPLISVIGEDGTLTDIDYPLKIGDFTFLVPEEDNPIRTDSESDAGDSAMEVDSGTPARLKSNRDHSAVRRVMAATSDISDGLYINCSDFEQYARAMLDAEVTVVRNVLSSCSPDTDRQRSLLYNLQTLCERRWSEEPALDIVDKLGCELLGNCGLVEFLVGHMRLLLKTQPELGKLQHTLPNTLRAELLKIQTDFLAARIAARALELSPEQLQSGAGAADGAQFSDVIPTPYGAFGTPPRPRPWGW